MTSTSKLHGLARVVAMAIIVVFVLSVCAVFVGGGLLLVIAIFAALAMLSVGQWLCSLRERIEAWDERVYQEAMEQHRRVSALNATDED